MLSSTTLAVVGAGPKGTAIAARACALQAVYGSAPQVTVIERAKVAANWSGSYGYTHGAQTLGTSPDKDVGFPYRPNAVSEYIYQNFSWRAFLIAEGEYNEWIDHGSPNPTHVKWSQYMSWVWDRILRNSKNNVIQLIIGEVPSGGICQEKQGSRRWKIQCIGPSSGSIVCDGIVFTGPGTPKTVDGASGHPQWMTGEDMWSDPRGCYELWACLSGRSLILAG